MNAGGKRILRNLACRPAQSVWVGSYYCICTGLLMTCVWQCLISGQGDLLGDCGSEKTGRVLWSLKTDRTRLAWASTKVVRSAKYNVGHGRCDIQTWVRRALLLIINANCP